MQQQNVEALQRLREIVLNDIADLYQGIGLISEPLHISGLCADIIFVVEAFVDQPQSFDLSEPDCMVFLTNTLPVLVEVFLRRKTKIENELDVVRLLTQVARLAAQSGSQDIEEMCEVRNMLLSGPGFHFRFINPKQLKIVNSNGTIMSSFQSGSGFYVEHGRPNTLIKGSKATYFWDDEWEQELSGFKAIGHFLKVDVGKGYWAQGKIVDYSVEFDMYGILLDEMESAEVDTHASESESPPHETVINVSLRKTKHFWNDPENKHRITAVPTRSVAATSAEHLLQFTSADEGQYIRVWWSRYKRYFYGRIISYDFSVRHHSIVYEDGDVRAYDLSAKEFDIIFPPEHLGEFLARVEADSDKSKIVAEWHRKQAFVSSEPKSLATSTAPDSAAVGAEQHHSSGALSEPLTAHGDGQLNMPAETVAVPADGYTASSSTASSTSAASSSQNISSITVSRVAASQGYNVCIHQYAVINQFFLEGGAEAVFQSMSDPNQPPPGIVLILLNLQLVYSLRQTVRSSVFRGLVWDAKESVPFALLRFEDAQIKDLNQNLLYEVLAQLKDLLLMTSPSHNSADPSSSKFILKVAENMDLLRLAAAKRLLCCSQLQKRYLGLSMIKEAIDCVTPKVSVYVTKRVAFLNPNKFAAGSRGSEADPAQRHVHSKDRFTLKDTQVEKWLLENMVIEELFGESIHQDLAAKADVVLVFLAHRNALTEKHLEALWQSARGAHEAVFRVLAQLILLIIPVLGPHLRMHLFNLISSVPAKDYTEQLLHLIKNYTVQTLISFKDEEVGKASATNSATIAGGGKGGGGYTDKLPDQSNTSISVAGRGFESATGGRKGQVVIAPQRQWLGFGVLWHFAQEPLPAYEGEIADNLLDLAIQLLVELLQEEFKEERELMMLRCLENIQAGKSVPASLQILRKTLGTYPAPVKGWFSVSRAAVTKTVTVSSQIERLEKQQRMLAIFFTDLAKYHRSIVDQMSPSSNHASAPSGSNSSGTGSSSSGSGGSSNTVVLSGAQDLQHTLPLPPQLSLVNPPTLSSNGGMHGGIISTDGEQQQQQQQQQQEVLPLRKVHSATNISDAVADKRTHKISRSSHLKGVVERLEFLKFVLSKSSICLDEAQTMLVWKALGEGAATPESLDQLVAWLEGMFSRESKTFCSLLTSLNQESDPLDPTLPSKLAFLGTPLSGSFLEVDTDHTSAFDDGVLNSLFEGSVTAWASKLSNSALLARPPVASFCMKLFLLVNVNNRAIRVDADGSWVRVGQLSGLTLLWRVAVDSTDAVVSNAAISLIIELHQRMPPKFKGSEQIRGYLLKICFKQLSKSIQSLRVGDEVIETRSVTASESSIASTVSDRQHAGLLSGGVPSGAPGGRPQRTGGTGATNLGANRLAGDGRVLLEEGYPIYLQGPRRTGVTAPAVDSVTPAAIGEDWVDDGEELPDSAVITRRIARFVMLLRLFIQRFQYAPTPLISIQVLAGKEDTPVTTITLRVTETVGVLRKRIADHFKESPDNITILKPGRTSQLLGGGIQGSPERLEKDSVTLKQAKFSIQDSVIARKKEQPPVVAGKAGAAAASATVSATTPVEDLIKHTDLNGDILSVLAPMEWMSKPASELDSDTSEEGAPASTAGSGPALSSINEASKSATKRQIPQPRRSLSGTGFVSTIPLLPFQPHADMTISAEYNSSSAVSGDTEQSSRLIDYLGPYLRNSPEYIDQLLEMLDGYLSTELQGAVGAEYDLSAAVWDVLQSLPTHPTLLKQIRDITVDASSIRHLLDPNSPYRLLYVLQIMDAFLSGENDVKAGVNPAIIPKKIMDWVLKFLYEGGPELLVNSLNSFIAKVVKCEMGSLASLSSFDSRSPGGVNDNVSSSGKVAVTVVGTKEKPWGSVSRGDAYVLIIAMLHRLLHRLLLFDPLYNCWQANYLLQSMACKPFAGDVMCGAMNRVPPGSVLSCFQANAFIQESLECCYRLTQAYANHQMSGTSLKTMVENALLLVLGLGTALDDGLEIFRTFAMTNESENGFRRWIRALCLRMPHPVVRQGICRRFFDACANIWYMCFDVSQSLTQEKKSSRLDFFDFIIRNVVNSSEVSSSTSHAGMSAAEAGLRPQLLSPVSDEASGVSTAGALKLTQTESHGPASFLGDSIYAEQLYTLIAALEALMLAPEVIFPANALHSVSFDVSSTFGAWPVSSSSEPAHQQAAVVSDTIVRVPREQMISEHVDRLCVEFILKLVRHKSAESFHSTEPDGTLIGILRVLLVLAYGKADQQEALGRYKFDASNSGLKHDDLIGFLYINGLFPADSLSLASSASPATAAGITTTSVVGSSVGEAGGLSTSMGAICQTVHSRTLAYAVLFQLCSTNETNFCRLMSVMGSRGGKEAEVKKQLTVAMAEASTAAATPAKRQGQLQLQGQGQGQGQVSSLSSSLFNKRTKRKKHVQWGYDPGTLVKDPGAFVGLVNQGGTCYMNSLLQQLYHVPALSNGLLSIETLPSKKSTTDLLGMGSAVSGEGGVGEEEEEDDNEAVLFQLQVLFGYLRLSQKRYYDTLPFCRVFKDYDGLPIRLGEQKDINEFAGMLFDKLENNAACKALLARTIQGTLVWKTRSTETTYRSEREEKFYMITAEVKNKATLEDSLELCVAEELFTGDNKLEDPVAGRKVEALRRCAFRHLPPAIIVHLKRFEFDLETMDRKKVNDLITFPMDLNMFPYSEEGLADKEAKAKGKADIDEEGDGVEGGASGVGVGAAIGPGKDDSSGSGPAASSTSAPAAPIIRDSSYYQYTLKGVVAHLGAIDRGHYYSFIKERSTDKWMEFNDRSVTPFSAESIPVECFGGEEQATSATGAPITRVRQNNAYLLFYERAINIPEDSHKPLQGLNEHTGPAGIGIGATDAGVEAVEVGVGAGGRQAIIAALNATDDLDGSADGEGKVTDEPGLGPLEPVQHHDKGLAWISRQPSVQYPDDDAAAGMDGGAIAADLSSGGGVSGVEVVDAPRWERAITKQSRGSSSSGSSSSSSGGRKSHRSGSGGVHSMAKRVLQAVWTENMEFQTDRCLFDVNHFRFLWQLQQTKAVNDILNKSAIGNFLADDSSISIDASTGADSALLESLTPEQKAKHLQAKETLGQMMILFLRFNVEVVARARAHNCVPMFFERLEEMVIHDGSRCCATAILTELALDNSLEFDLQTLAALEAAKAAAAPLGSASPLTSSPRRNADQALLQRTCHAWLLQMYQQCPFGTTLRSFTRFLLVCVRMLRPEHKLNYLHRETRPLPPPAPVNDSLSTARVDESSNTGTGDFLTPTKAAAPLSEDATHDSGLDDPSVPPAVHVDDFEGAGDERRPQQLQSQESQQLQSLESPSSLGVSLSSEPSTSSPSPLPTEDVGASMLLMPLEDAHQRPDPSTFASCVTRFVNKLLVIAERTRSEDVYGREGFRKLTQLLLQISNLGFEEKRMFLGINAPYRLVCAMLSINPSVTGTPNEELQHCTELVAVLVRSTAVRRAESTGAPNSPKSLTDASSFTQSTRSPFMTAEALTAMDGLPDEDMLYLSPEDLQAFLNRIYLEDAISIGTIPTCTALQHICWSRGGREAIKVLEFVTEKVTECASAAGGANLAYRAYFRAVSELLLGPAIDITLAFDTVIPSLIQKADMLAVRQNPNDAEFIYSVLKLLHRLGTSSSRGHACIMRVRDLWHNIHAKFAQNKRHNSKSTDGSGGGSAGSADGGNIAFTTTAYLMA